MAHIAVIPKPNKDHKECASYRPISLLNIDLKLLAKILANRLKPLLSKIIGPEKVGFMPGREARDNTTKALNLIHFSRNSETKGLLLSTDAEKAFNRVSWDYIMTTCSHIGLNESMLSWTSALYRNPQAKIKVNNILSDPIKIHNGTRQGCPLSPFLFIISLEPLIRTINLSEDIRGFRVGGREYKIAAYADDLLLFLTHPHISIPNLEKHFETFGYISNFKVNKSKSEALNINLPSDQLKLMKDNHNYKWEQNTLKYLGINLTI